MPRRLVRMRASFGDIGCRLQRITGIPGSLRGSGLGPAYVAYKLPPSDDPLSANDAYNLSESEPPVTSATSLLLERGSWSLHLARFPDPPIIRGTTLQNALLSLPHSLAFPVRDEFAHVKDNGSTSRGGTGLVYLLTFNQLHESLEMTSTLPKVV